MIAKPAALAFAVLCLSGCSLLPSREARAPAFYQLGAAAPENGVERNLNAQLAVEEPISPRGLNTDRVALWSSPLQLKYVEDARWADRAPRMVQGVLVESFQRTLSAGGVARAGGGMRADYSLATELQDFAIDDMKGGAPSIRLRLNVSLLRSSGGRLIAGRLFEETVQARNRSTDAAVEAFDEALHRIAAKTVNFTVDTIAALPPPRRMEERRVSVPPPLPQAETLPEPPR